MRGYQFKIANFLLICCGFGGLLLCVCFNYLNWFFLQINKKNTTVWEAPDKEALFGPLIPDEGIWVGVKLGVFTMLGLFVVVLFFFGGGVIVHHLS